MRYPSPRPGSEGRPLPLWRRLERNDIIQAEGFREKGRYLQVVRKDAAGPRIRWFTPRKSVNPAYNGTTMARLHTGKGMQKQLVHPQRGAALSLYAHFGTMPGKKAGSHKKFSGPPRRRRTCLQRPRKRRSSKRSQSGRLL